MRCGKLMGKEYGVLNELKNYLMKDIESENKMKELESKINDYKNFINEYSKFIENLENVVELNLDIWLNVAKLYELPVRPVLIKEAFESLGAGIEASLEEISIPDIGKIDISNNIGTVVFVDISKSTDFFKEEKRTFFEEKTNYTSFVIFNSYISLVKSYVRLSGGEFLEHTGDGSMIFYNRNLIKDYNSGYKNRNDLKKHPLDIMFYIGYLLQNKAKEYGLLDFLCNDSECYSLVHIGAAYGEVLDVNLGDMRKMISSTVWQAANNCKDAPRKFFKGYAYDFKELPIKI